MANKFKEGITSKNFQVTFKKKMRKAGYTVNIFSIKSDLWVHNFPLKKGF